MSRKILLADDSVTIQKVVELTFMDEDVEVATFGDGAEALERLDDVAPDLVVADVHMPGADGYEVCREVKQRRPGTPVLLLVGTFEPFDEDEARSAGADAFLKKPFDSQDLLQQVEDLLRGADGDDLDDDEGDQTTGRLSLAEDAAPAPVDETADTRPRSAIEVPAEEPAPAPASVEAEAGEQAAAAEAVPAPPAGDGPDEPAPEQGAEAPAPEAAAANGGALDDEAIDRIARRVVELLGDTVLREVAWEVVPDLAEIVIKERIKELESQVE